jgi:hypothetical protein
MVESDPAPREVRYEGDVRFLRYCAVVSSAAALAAVATATSPAMFAGVFGTAALLGFLSARRRARFYALTTAGVLAIVGIAGWLIATGPTPEGSAGGSETFGHWVSNQQVNWFNASLVAWIAGMFVGRVALARWTQSHQRLPSTPA